MDHFAQLDFLCFSQILNTSIRIDTRLLQNLIGQLPSDAVDIGQTNFYALFSRKVYTGNSCHLLTHLLCGSVGNQPCFCLCFGFVQITMTRPLRRMILHFSQIGFTDGLTFIEITSIRLCRTGMAACNASFRGVNLDYLDLQVILPLVRSYGETCTVTLSPGRMRI